MRRTLPRLLSLVTLAAGLSLATSTASAQQLLGARITGTAFFEQVGLAVALSADGSRVAVPSTNIANGSGQNTAGRVRVFDYVNGAWVQVGSDIFGSVGNERFGSSVAMSDDGTRLVVGGDGVSNSATSGGVVRVYDLVNGAWQQTGADLVGGTNDRFGSAVAISGNGGIIAAASAEGTSVSGGAGYVKTYSLVAGNWQQRGATVLGRATGDRFGSAVDLNFGGTFLVVGAPQSDSGGANAGSVETYFFAANDWQLTGGVNGVGIDGDAAGDLFGFSVGIAASNYTIIAGAPGANSGDGRVRVYQLQGSNFNVLGADFDGAPGSGERLGNAVALSADFSRVVMGAEDHQAGVFVGAGRASVYDYTLSTDSWQQVGSTVVGGEYFEGFGAGVAISADGSRYAIGANDFSGTGPNRKGAVSVFSVATILPVEFVSFTARASGTRVDADVRLDWQTASERDNAGFEVERSGDGDGWVSIGFTPAATEGSSDGAAYSATDEAPLPGVNYYRLRQLDFDGTASLSAVRSVWMGAGAGEVLKVYPNPTDADLTIMGAEDGTDVEVVDALGRLVYAGQLSGGRLPFAALSSGVYVVRVGEASVRVVRR